MGWPVSPLFFKKMSHAYLCPLRSRTPTAVVDQEDRVITILAGRPQGSDWSLVQQKMSALLEDAPLTVQGRRGKERRGIFVSLSAGISYGGGQTVRACQYVLLLLY